MAHPFNPHAETAPMLSLVWGESLGAVVATLIVDQPRLASRLDLPADDLGDLDEVA